MAKVSEQNEGMVKDKYVVGLEGLHGAFAEGMGKPVYAPVDLSKSGLKILDSGCNTGCWLIDLAKLSAPAAHEYVGTDIWTAIFPKNPPENIRFFEQDICKPWPSEWQESFDLVHQRTVLVNIRKTPIKNVLSQMIKLLKPDGWIQLMEGDFAPVPGNGPALQEFLSLGSWFFDAAGPGSDMGPMFQEELKSLDLRDVQDEVVYVHFGAKLKDHGPAVAQGSIEGLCAAIPGSLENIRGMEPPLSAAQLSTLEKRLRKELEEVGGSIRYRVAWGRK